MIACLHRQRCGHRLESLLQSHPAGAALDRAVAQHKDETAKIAEILLKPLQTLLEIPGDADMSSIASDAVAEKLRNLASLEMKWF